ncbi:MAG: 50S ribosome-binding GTPase, partial [Candidatus Aminicenantes bacterium]
LKSQIGKKPAVARHGPTFHIDKAGAGQIVLVGLPNAGKSMLVKSLTNASPEVRDYPFTTHSPSPAMMMYENIQVQLIDTPPLTADFMEVWHAEMIKGADGILVVIDLSREQLLDDYQVLHNKLAEKKIVISPPSSDTDSPDFGFRKKTLIVGNKSDHPSAKENFRLLKDIVHPDSIILAVSAARGDNLENLKNEIFTLLEVLRVYSKVPGKKADRKDPFILQKGSTLMDMAKAVHKDFAVKLKFARIWNADKFQGQKVNRDYELQDEDIIELHI